MPGPQEAEPGCGCLQDGGAAALCAACGEEGEAQEQNAALRSGVLVKKW